MHFKHFLQCCYCCFVSVDLVSFWSDTSWFWVKAVDWIQMVTVETSTFCQSEQACNMMQCYLQVLLKLILEEDVFNATVLAVVCSLGDLCGMPRQITKTFDSKTNKERMRPSGVQSIVRTWFEIVYHFYSVE